MTWWVALIVAVCAGVVLAASLLVVCPEVSSTESAEGQVGLSLVAGIALAIGLYVALVAA